MTKQFQKVAKALLITLLAALVLFVSLPTETMAAGKKKAAPKKYVKSLSVKPASATIDAGKSATVNATVKVKGKVNTRLQLSHLTAVLLPFPRKQARRGRARLPLRV